MEVEYIIKRNKKLSIQITDASIHIVIGNKNKIYETQTIELKREICKHGNIIDKEYIIKLLSDYLDVKARDIKNISFVLGGTDLITRYIEVPIVKRDVLIENIKFEFKQFIPNMNDYYMNFEIVEKINTSQRKSYKVLLVAASKKKIDPIIDISKGVGKELEVIDILSNTLARVLKNANYLINDKSTGIFYFGSNSSTLGIMEGNILKFERNIPFGVKNIFNESYEEVASSILNNKIVDDNFKNNTNLMRNFENLLVSVNNTIRYYNSEKGNKPITNFIIICQDMIITNMESYLKKYFELPFILIKDSLDLGLKLKFKENFSEYIGAYGLLLRDNKNKLLNLNPTIISKEIKKSNINRLVIKVPIIILTSIIIAGFSFCIINNIISRDINVIEKNINRYLEILEKNDKLKSENNKMQYFINKIDNIENGTKKTSYILESINNYVPKEISFFSLSLSEDSVINIIGESDSYEKIAVFLANLEMSEKFSNVTISYINPIEKDIESPSLHNIEDNILNKNIKTITNYSFSIFIEGVNKSEDKKN